VVSTAATTAAAAVEGADLALLTARVVVDAMALTCAQDYACSCKEIYYMILCICCIDIHVYIIIVTREIGDRLRRRKASKITAL
jgi:hypothetical protein